MSCFGSVVNFSTLKCSYHQKKTRLCSQFITFSSSDSEHNQSLVGLSSHAFRTSDPRIEHTLFLKSLLEQHLSYLTSKNVVTLKSESKVPVRCCLGSGLLSRTLKCSVFIAITNKPLILVWQCVRYSQNGNVHFHF